MNPQQEFLLIAGTHFLALLSPGPDFLLVIRTATRFGSRAAILASAGIAMANAIYIACALFGIAVMQRMPILLDILRWAGCAYLVYLGVCILGCKDAAPTDSVLTPAPQTNRSVFWVGLFSGLLNPKNMLFYFSLFSLAAQSTSTSLRCFYGLWMIGVVFIWDTLLAQGLGRGHVHLILQKHIARVEKTTGMLFLLIAGGMISSGIMGH